MDKIRVLQNHMEEWGLQAVLINDASNRFYLTGMKSSAGTVIVTKKNAVLFIDFRYLEEAEAKVYNCKVVEEKKLFCQIEEYLGKLGIQEVSLHSEYVSVARCREIKEMLPNCKVDASDKVKKAFYQLRSIKDEDEIGWHRKAQEITDHVFSHLCGYIKPGITELDVAREMGTMLTRLGSEDKHFNFIVASGKNSSLPHGFATGKMIENGDFVTMDFGAVVGGRLADMTRTIAVGKVSQEQREVYDTVLEAQKRALSIIKPGVVCNQVDAAARNYIYGKGYEGCFSHGLGHSVGVEVHEEPRFNEVCTEKLREGMILTVEPGIYLKNRFGVRIEDMIVIRENGLENLTQSSKELIIL